MEPLLEALKSLTQQVQGASPGDTATLKQLLGTARLALRTFFSMNSPGLTPVRALWQYAPTARRQAVLAGHHGCMRRPHCSTCSPAWPATAELLPAHHTCLSCARRLLKACCCTWLAGCRCNSVLPAVPNGSAAMCACSVSQHNVLQAFEKTLSQWMEQFHTLLTYSNPALAEPAPDTESALDAVKAAVCQNINLLIGRDEEEFEPFLARFVEAVWMQLVSVTLNPGQVCTCCRSWLTGQCGGSADMRQLCGLQAAPGA